MMSRGIGSPPEVDADDVRLRVLLGEDINRLDVVGGGHRAFHRHRQGHGIAVIDQRRQVELHAAALDRRVAGDLADRLLEGRLATIARPRAGSPFAPVSDVRIASSPKTFPVKGSRTMKSQTLTPS